MPSKPDPNASEHKPERLENISIKLPKKQGENAIQLLSHLKLLNGKLVPVATKEAIFLPLIRAPQLDEREEIEKTFGKAILTHGIFRTRPATIVSFEEILSRNVPEEIVPFVSKSFDIIGDIAIIELSPTAEPYERTIAEALTQVHPRIRTVFSKAGPIVDSLRLRPLHLVLGENRSETVHKEHGCRFKVDVSKAFFSPRLSSEHKRIVDQVISGEVVVDMFAGVGPFSVLIAKRIDNVVVHAIDANPEAAKLVAENAILNRVQDKINVWRGDAHKVIDRNLVRVADRVIMNHPSEAKNFLEDATQAVKSSGGTLHYYTFTDGEDCEIKAEEELTGSLSNSTWEVERTSTHRVRGVAPMKWQIAVDARLVPG